MLLSNLKNEYRVWSWYSKAMERRGRVALSFRAFFSHFNGGSFSQTFRFGNGKDGFLLGVEEKGLFVPTHFAPRTLRGGYRLFEELRSVPSLLAVTDDLSLTLKKMPGWYKLPVRFSSSFRGEDVSKTIMINRLGIISLGKFLLKEISFKFRMYVRNKIDILRYLKPKEVIIVSSFDELDESVTFIMD